MPVSGNGATLLDERELPADSPITVLLGSGAISSSVVSWSRMEQIPMYAGTPSFRKMFADLSES